MIPNTKIETKIQSASMHFGLLNVFDFFADENLDICIKVWEEKGKKGRYNAKRLKDGTLLNINQLEDVHLIKSMEIEFRLLGA